MGVHAVRRAGLRPGETVAVIGAGTIGLASVMAAKALGAGRCTPWPGTPSRPSWPWPWEPRRPSPIPRTRRAAGASGDGWGGRGDRDGGGHATTLDQAWALVRRKGRVIVLGVFEGAVPVRLGPALGKEADVRFAVCYGELDGRHDYDVTLELIASGKAPVGRLLTHRFPLRRPPGLPHRGRQASGAVKVQLIP